MPAASRVRLSHSAYPVPCFMRTCKLLSVSGQAHLILQSSSTEAESVAASRQPGPELFQHPHDLLQPDPPEDGQGENEEDAREAIVWEGDGRWLRESEEVNDK